VNLFSTHAPVLATVAETWRPTIGNDIRHIVLDFGDSLFPVLEGQTIGILTPGNDTDGRPHAMRAYSVASARTGEHPGTNTVALTVKRIVTNHDGNTAYGVCSNYLCDLAVGDRVQVVGPYGQSFLAPNAAGTKMLMICTGTGIAPMRGMIEQRRRHPVNDGDDLALFYGARSPADMPYHDDLVKLPHRQLDLNLAFSRVAGRTREYVQDLLMRRSVLVMALLQDPQCCIYLCGIRGMEAAVMQVFAEICCMYGGDWSTLEAQLREQRRLHIETY
jgi:benzoyl-CoA 2,3-dioxygenase component A